MSKSYRLFTTETTDGGYTVDDGVAVDDGASIYSNCLSCDNASGISMEMRWTDGPTGTITMWKSNKPDPNRDNDDDWVQVDDNLADPTGSAGDTGDELGNFRAALVRWKYEGDGAGMLYGYASVSRMN